MKALILTAIAATTLMTSCTKAWHEEYRTRGLKDSVMHSYYLAKKLYNAGKINDPMCYIDSSRGTTIGGDSDLFVTFIAVDSITGFNRNTHEVGTIRFIKGL